MTDAFEIFQIEPSFDLDLEELARRHRELSRALHPDRYVGRPASERRQSLSRAIEVNEAWRKLRDPLSRAELLLARLGSAPDEGSQPSLEPEFLMEMMERRETLQKLGLAGDSGGIELLSRQVRAEEERALTELRESFRIALRGGEVPPALSRRLGELRYFRRFFDEVTAWMD